MATGWKRWIEMGLVRGGLPRLALRRRSRDVAILAYHNIVPTGESVAGDRSLHVDQADFARQLDLILQYAEVIPLSDIDVPSSGSRLRVVITFDDAYRGAMTAGLAELERRGLPSTVFVPTGLMGGKGFWWDLLSKDDQPLDPGVRAHVLRELKGDGVRAVRWARERGYSIATLPDHALPISEDELLHVDHDRLSLGAHSVTHANLTELLEHDLRTELLESKRWLEERTPRYVDWLAYPYGHTDASVARVALEVFEGAVRVDGGVIDGVNRPHRGQIPRINVPRGLTLDGLLLRLSGLIR